MFSRNTTKKALLVAIVLSLFLLTLTPMNSLLPSAAAQASSTSCSADQTLKLGLYGGAPNTFNMLSALPVAGVVSSLLQYYQMYPPPAINGVLDYNESVINGYSHNANYTQWIFNVKPGLKWSDGSSVSAEDILRTYSQNFALNSTVDFVNAAAEIKNETTLNATAAVFNLNKSDAVFPLRVGSSLFTPIMPQSFIQNGPTFDGFGTTDVVMGPFYASNYSTGAPQGVFLRNPYFQPLPHACQLIMQYFESDSSIPTYVASDQVDFGPIPPSAAASLVNTPNVHIIDQKGLVPEMLSYNVSAYPYNMTAFRQALVYAINMSAVQQLADAGYNVLPYNAEGGIPPVATKWYSSNQPTYNYDPAHAVSLLKSIGFTQDSGGTLHYPNGTAVSLTIWYDNSFASNAEAMNIVQTGWQGIGISVTSNAAALGTLIQDSYQNTNNINHEIMFLKSYGAIYGYAWTAGLPSFQIDIPFNAPPTWEGPPGSAAQNNFEGNLSALASTDNETLQYKYLSNIQLLNAQNVPVINIGYGDAVWAYNNQRWSNWPSSLVILPNTLNSSALALLQPTSGSSTSSSSTAASQSNSSSSTTTSSPQSSTQSTTSSSSSSSTAAPSTSSSSSGTSVDLTMAAVAVVVVIIAAAGVTFALRTRKK